MGFATMPSMPQPSSLKLGEILVRMGACTSAHVEEALAARRPEERIGEALVRLGHAGEGAVLEALGRQAGMAVVDLDDASVDAEFIKTIPIKAIFQRPC